jgi:hypothetical protein
MSKRSDNRRENLRRLIKEYDGPKELAEKLGYANASFLVQMTGPNPTREVTEKTARKFEAKLGIEEGSLDWPANQRPVLKPVPGKAPAAQDTSLAVDIVRLVGQVCEEQGVTLPAVKFADVVALALADAAETGRQPTAEHLRRLVALLKP